MSNLQEKLNACPWCGSKKSETWGNEVRGFKSQKCLDCSLVYISNPLNEDGLKNYYSNYLTRIHQSKQKMTSDREEMYKVEFSLVRELLKPRSKVLDVGCSGGYFLERFEKENHECYGVEFGIEAAKEAQKKYKIWTGSFPLLDIVQKFDLIIFRGVIEHVRSPKSYLNKAIELLNEGGIVLITSTPNANALCCDLFKDKWNQHNPEAHLFHFSPDHFDRFFEKNNFNKIGGHFPYRETPYANLPDDLLKVSKAISLKENGQDINFVSPAFYESMMTLIYKNNND